MPTEFNFEAKLALVTGPGRGIERVSLAVEG